MKGPREATNVYKVGIMGRKLIKVTSMSLFLWHSFIFSYCSFSPCRTIYFFSLSQSFCQETNCHILDWQMSIHVPPSVGIMTKMSLSPPEGFLAQPAAATPGPCRRSALAAVPPTMPASSTENSKRSWLLPELHVEIHSCPISLFPVSLWETAKTFRRKVGLYDLFTYAGVSASSRGTVYWPNWFAVKGETYDTDMQTWY